MGQKCSSLFSVVAGSGRLNHSPRKGRSCLELPNHGANALRQRDTPSTSRSRARRTRKSCAIVRFICAQPSSRMGPSRLCNDDSNSVAVRRDDSAQPTTWLGRLS
ncbi:hypothetical protein D3C72_1223060 [compost metagenome]